MLLVNIMMSLVFKLAHKTVLNVILKVSVLNVMVKIIGIKISVYLYKNNVSLDIFIINKLANVINAITHVLHAKT